MYRLWVKFRWWQGEKGQREGSTIAERCLAWVTAAAFITNIRSLIHRSISLQALLHALGDWTVKALLASPQSKTKNTYFRLSFNHMPLWQVPPNIDCETVVKPQMIVSEEHSDEHQQINLPLEINTKLIPSPTAPNVSEKGVYWTSTNSDSSVLYEFNGTPWNSHARQMKEEIMFY